MKTPDKYTIEQNTNFLAVSSIQPYAKDSLLPKKKKKCKKNVQHKKRPNDRIKNATVDKLKIVSVSDLVQV